MRYPIQHKETKEILFGEWDNESLYFNTDNFAIPLRDYDKYYNPIENDYNPFAEKIPINTYEYRSFSTEQLKWKLTILERDIKNNNYKVERDQKRVNQINKILNK